MRGVISGKGSHDAQASQTPPVAAQPTARVLVATRFSLTLAVLAAPVLATAMSRRHPDEWTGVLLGATVLLVTQRLKLARVSPLLMKLYREEELTLEQLMAFTVSDDHAAQEAAWFETPDYDRSPRGIRRRGAVA